MSGEPDLSWASDSILARLVKAVPDEVVANPEFVKVHSDLLARLTALELQISELQAKVAWEKSE